LKPLVNNIHKKTIKMIGFMRDHEIHRPGNEELFYQNGNDILSPEITDIDIKDKISIAE